MRTTLPISTTKKNAFTRLNVSTRSPCKNADNITNKHYQ
jgi:hypothetical protein